MRRTTGAQCIAMLSWNDTYHFPPANNSSHVCSFEQTTSLRGRNMYAAFLRC